MNLVLFLIIRAYFVPFHVLAEILVLGDQFQDRGKED